MKLARRSLTLIELLLVLTILAALAASAASFVEDSDEQFRYQDTKNRLTSIREGILGTATGTSRTEGFVVDNGRLPLNLRDLVQHDGTLPAWTIDDGSDPTGELALLRGHDPETGLGFGWRGPYLQAQPRASDGLRTFPDGWGSRFEDTDHNFGWLWELSPTDDLSLKSIGRDGVPDSSPPPSDPYARDYPPSPSGGPVNYLAARSSYAVRARGLRIEVTIRNNATSPIPSTARLRLRYFGYVETSSGRVSLSGGAGTERRQISLLSDSQALPSNSAPNNVSTVVFTFNTVAGSPTDTPEFLPMGPKAIDLVDGATPGVGLSSGPALVPSTPPWTPQVLHLDLRPGASATLRVGPTFEVD